MQGLGANGAAQSSFPSFLQPAKNITCDYCGRVHPGMHHIDGLDITRHNFGAFWRGRNGKMQGFESVKITAVSNWKRRFIALGTASCLVGLASTASAVQQKFDLDDAPKKPAIQAPATGEALWPVPSRSQWGQIITQKGSNVWQDAVFTDLEGRWQIVYPATLTEPHGDALGRDRWFSYPGQPHIVCGAMLVRGAFRSLGENAIAEAPAALVRDPGVYVSQVADGASPVLSQKVVALASPGGVSGTPVQAVTFDQRGKLFALLGVDREVFVRHVLVSDGTDLLDVFCGAQPGQKGWVEKQALAAVRLTTAARTQR